MAYSAQGAAWVTLTLLHLTAGVFVLLTLVLPWSYKPDNVLKSAIFPIIKEQGTNAGIYASYFVACQTNGAVDTCYYYNGEGDTYILRLIGQCRIGYTAGIGAAAILLLFTVYYVFRSGWSRGWSVLFWLSISLNLAEFGLGVGLLVWEVVYIQQHDNLALNYKGGSLSVQGVGYNLNILGIYIPMSVLQLAIVIGLIVIVAQKSGGK